MADPAFVAGSGRGIGRGMTLCLAGNGYDIALHCRACKNAAEEVNAATGDLGRLAGRLRFGSFSYE